MAFVIIHKNRVIAGPLPWSQKYFTTVLKIRHKIDSNIPGIEPEVFPYVINEDTVIRKAVENRPELNEMIHYHYGPLWDFSKDTVVANYEVKEVSIETARDNFKTLLAAQRYKKEIVGAKITLREKELSLDTSREGRNVFIQKFLLMSDTETVNWKFPECWFNLTKDELGQIVFAGASHIQSAFDWEKEIAEKIDAAQTIEELLNLIPVIKA